MTKKKFSNILKQRIRKNALEYHTGKQGKKGKGIQYSDMKISEYLLHSNKELNISKKRKLFAIRNGMVDIPSNFPQTKTNNIQEKCLCGQTENMVHIYVCEILSEKENQEQLENIFVGQQLLKIWKKTWKKEKC